jgi:hypothetical protein
LADVLNYSTFHDFVREHERAVVFASWLKHDDINPFVVQHFTRVRKERLPVVRLDLSTGVDWFSTEVRAALGEGHGPVDTFYYLIVTGSIVARHSGAIDNELALSAYALFSRDAGATTFLSESKATTVITFFEPVLSRYKPRRAKKSVSPAAIEKPPDPHTVLGVKRGATDDEIDSAHRRRVLECHPDRVATMGPEIRKLAEKLTADINAARDELRRGR